MQNPKIQDLSWETLKPLLPPRHYDAHKNDFGYVLVVGGDYGTGGAARMAGEAALRTGAGLVTVATRPEYTWAQVGACPELMSVAVNQAIDVDAALTRTDVVVLGPGLGQTDWGQALFEHISESPLPMIVDGDALNLLAKNPKNQNQSKQKQWILTPHPGEAARLLNVSTSDIQNNRTEAITALQAQFGGVIVLKGAGTLIMVQDSPQIFRCPAGNPGMAIAGMGDILSGIIAGLLAQKLSLINAACLGVMTHALASDQIAKTKGERGMLARDILPEVRHYLNNLE